MVDPPQNPLRLRNRPKIVDGRDCESDDKADAINKGTSDLPWIDNTADQQCEDDEAGAGQGDAEHVHKKIGRNLRRLIGPGRALVCRTPPTLCRVSRRRNALASPRGRRRYSHVVIPRRLVSWLSCRCRSWLAFVADTVTPLSRFCLTQRSDQCSTADGPNYQTGK